jgi:hypothetical protein
MYKQFIVYRNRTNVITVNLGEDVSADTFVSEIREDPKWTAQLIATWVVSFATNGVDGKLVLTLDDSVSQGITQSSGFMDIKRIRNGEPIPVFDRPIQILFRDTVTA